MSMESRFPRVLVVSGYTFNDESGGSITMSNLFRGWPLESLAIIDADPREHYPERCTSRFRLARAVQEGAGLAAVRPKTNWRSEFRRYVHLGARLLGVADGVLPIRRKSGLVEFVKAFAPEIIYTQASQLSYLNLTVYLAKATCAPVVYHIMDDFPSTAYKKGLASVVVRGIFLSRVRKLVADAKLCMGISEGMCAAYKRRYGRNFLCFHNPIDIDRWMRMQVREACENRELRLVYSGRVGAGARTTIENLISVVRDLQPTQAIRLDIYSQDHVNIGRTVAELGASPAVGVSPAPGAIDHLINILRSADLLVIPIDFDEESRQFLRYSMPTKVPAYMASGTPCLVVGPLGTVVVDYAVEEGWAHVVHESGAEPLKNKLLSLAADPEMRMSCASIAQRLAAQQFDSLVVRRRFKEAIRSAVDNR